MCLKGHLHGVKVVGKVDVGVSDTWDGGWNTALGTKILYLAHVNIAEPKEVLNIGFLSHLTTLFPSFLHHHCLQFLYSTNFLIRECFSLLVCTPPIWCVIHIKAESLDA